MKIYTRKGDTGYCSLLSGDRVPKSSVRVRAIGAIDELSANLGMLKSHLVKKDTFEHIEKIQSTLYAIMGHLACNKGKHPDMLPEITRADIEFLEKQIDAMNETLPELKKFILPGGNVPSAWCDISRTVCRRAESLCVELFLTEKTNEIIIAYLNRLSDYLFTLGRQLREEAE